MERVVLGATSVVLPTRSCGVTNRTVLFDVIVGMVDPGGPCDGVNSGVDPDGVLSGRTVRTIFSGGVNPVLYCLSAIQS